MPENNVEDMPMIDDEYGVQPLDGDVAVQDTDDGLAPLPAHVAKEWKNASEAGDTGPYLDAENLNYIDGDLEAAVARCNELLAENNALKEEIGELQDSISQIDRGYVISGQITANNMATLRVVFNKEYEAAPIVVATISSGTGTDKGLVLVQASADTSGAYLYVYNKNNVAVSSIRVNWIAIGTTESV